VTGSSKEDQVASKRIQVGKVKAETADHVTRMAKKLFVDERWDVADSMREDLDALRMERQEKEAAYVARARSINARTSNEPARNARRQMYEKRLADAKRVRDTRVNVVNAGQDQRVAAANEKQAIHAQVHASKFVPMAAVRASPERLKPFFSYRSPGRLTNRSKAKAPQEVTL